MIRPRLILPAIAGLAVAAALWASSRPDGLETVALAHGFAHTATAQPAPFADYFLPGHPGLAVGVLVAVLGTALCLALGAGLAALAHRPT